MRDPSLLRFLVDVREADPSDKQLRDDLMTMLIAGHETTAAVLTWCVQRCYRHLLVPRRSACKVCTGTAPPLLNRLRVQLTPVCVAHAGRCSY